MMTPRISLGHKETFPPDLDMFKHDRTILSFVGFILLDMLSSLSEKE